MKTLDDYFALQAQIYEYFGYREDWKVIPLDDSRSYFWKLEGEGPGVVKYAETEEELTEETGQFYSDEIYTQRFLPKWVYRGAEYTMIACDPHVDGNKFLRVFANDHERK